MKTNIIINLSVEGLHRWKDAKNKLIQVRFLSDLHRHNFYITCKKLVNHDDRDIEFIDYKHNIVEYLTEKYFDKYYKCLLFDNMSCEMIAKELLAQFDLEYCSCMEDNENGAEVYV